MTKSDPVFIVGVFRSGTSLLCSLLNQSPHIALMYELDIWNFPKPLLKHRLTQNWAQRLEFYNQALSRHRMVLDHNDPDLALIRTPLDLYQRYAAMKGAKVYGEKSPFYCNRLNQLYKLYPKASFIIVWRPPLEIYRSILQAGQTSRFFSSPGMFSRMVFQQESLIRQSHQLKAKGARVLEVDYAGIVDQTETQCRRISDFLNIPFAPQMLNLKQADLQSVYKAPHHAHLRRGIIERQQFPAQLVSSATSKKVEHYTLRWEQMRSNSNPGSAPRPGMRFTDRWSFFFHRTAGGLWTLYDSIVRAGFEILPLTWLTLYRLLKGWVITPPSGTIDEKSSLLQDFKSHWQAIGFASVLFMLTVWLHRLSDPHLLFLLFYSVPCSFLALTAGPRWATLFVLLSAIAGPLIQYDNDVDYQSRFVFIWNFLTRFLLLETFILTLSRIRLEFSRQIKPKKEGNTEMLTRATPAAGLKFSIITPSFRNSAWLKLCIASVADQQGVELEHLVQDSCSDDGTLDWLPNDPRVTAFIEKDQGMYDAVNRGYRRATGDILAYLNCDEQYLPGALKAVRDFFESHPLVEVLLAGSIVTDGEGKYLCHRPSLTPNARHMHLRFPVLTSSIFIRRRVIQGWGIYFDTKWRDLGDYHWMQALMNAGVPMAVSDVFTSVFADTGDNMNLKPNAIREKKETLALTPIWVRWLKPAWILHHRLRRLVAGHFTLKATTYSLYTRSSPERRVTVDVPRPTAVWWNRL